MAKVTTCDGTGIEIPEDTPFTGEFEHQYCPAARHFAEKYLEDLDNLHTKHAEAFQLELDDLRKLYREHLRQLPDDPA